MKRFKKFLYALLALVLVTVAVILLCNAAVERAARGRLFSDTDKVPYHRVGLLLGTSKFLGDGSVNLYYSFRIRAAAELYHAGKVRYIIASGDNSRKDYNEPAEMRADLVRAGVDSSRIYLDYAGLRTFDSMVRLREIFGQDSVTIISQPFHNERALYIAKREGIVAVGYNARDVAGRSAFRQGAREKLARVKLFLDYLTGQDPKYLGEKVPIPQ